jgi:hypothetical protein
MAPPFQNAHATQRNPPGSALCGSRQNPPGFITTAWNPRACAVVTRSTRRGSSLLWKHSCASQRSDAAPPPPPPQPPSLPRARPSWWPSRQYARCNRPTRAGYAPPKCLSDQRARRAMVIVPNFSISLKPRVSTDFPWRTRSLFALSLRAQAAAPRCRARKPTSASRAPSSPNVERKNA